ncbi:MAG TPA: BrnT family toxin [Candidatus Tectomicrobia bacterium]
MRYIFSWDPRKAKDNLHNHRISFEHAATIFRDPQALSIFDVAHSDEEDRWITIGFDQSGRLLVMVHTFH